MKRISGHAIDPKYLEGCKPIPANIAVYIDGYGAKLTAEALYEEGDKQLYEMLRAQSEDKPGRLEGLYDALHKPPAPSVHADLISLCLALVELHVVAIMEERISAAGTVVRPNSWLVNKSNPLEFEMEGVTHNVLDLFHPLTERQFEAGHYLDVTCNGTIFAPRRINPEAEVYRLRQELVSARLRNDQSRVAWIEKNLSTIPDGVLHRRMRDGSIGWAVDFQSLERFYEAVAQQVGDYSDWGETKVHWGHDLGDFGEKGVDCDLIMRVMDDLHSGQVDAFVFITNDMDFFPLIERIRHQNKAVFLCGLGGRVSNRLKRAVGKDNFFDFTSQTLINALPHVFMTPTPHLSREMALQWTYLSILNERRRNSD